MSIIVDASQYHFLFVYIYRFLVNSIRLSVLLWAAIQLNRFLIDLYRQLSLNNVKELDKWFSSLFSVWISVNEDSYMHCSNNQHIT